jgi:hypothetical protein
MRRTTGLGIAIPLSALLCCVGCKSVDRFDTAPGSAYCGEMVGGIASDGLVPDRSAVELKLSLTLDTRPPFDYPGRLTSNDESGGLCAPARLFDNARLRTVQAALHDMVSSIQITPDHEQDTFTWIDSTCQGTFVCILSLMYDGRVELRLFKPMPDVDAGAPAQLRAGFGLFSLARSESGCGF